MRTVADHLRQPECNIERVTLAVFGAPAFETHRQVMLGVFGEEPR